MPTLLACRECRGLYDPGRLPSARGLCFTCRDLPAGVEVVTLPRLDECPACDGAGALEVERNVGDPEQPGFASVECVECDGSGEAVKGSYEVAVRPRVAR